MNKYKIFGVNPAEKGGADTLGDASNMTEAEKVADGAAGRYESFEIRNVETGHTEHYVPNKSKAA